MTDAKGSDEHKTPPGDNRAVIRGAGFAFLGRLGALIEPISVFAFAKLYGVATFGVFLYLWGAVQLISTFTDLGMTTALQRFVPTQKTREDEHRVVRIALFASFLFSTASAAVIASLAPFIAPHIQTEGLSHDFVASVIRVYAFALPLWCFIDVSTAAIRAQRVFGPEIRVRIFYEQGLRLLLGVAFFFLNWDLFGLIFAHLLALFAAALLACRLLARFYDVKALLPRRDPLAAEIFSEMRRYASVIMFNNFGKRMQSFMPIFLLNFLIPGAAGASAVAIYGVARKIVSALQVIRQTFEYVLAPFASAKNGRAEKEGLRTTYAFATRCIIAAFLPIATGIIVVGPDLLGFIDPAFQAGAAALVILTVGRGIEAATGPSSAIIEMIGRYRLPFYNVLAGNVALAVLLFLLVPDYGVTGGAIASAIGINVTSILALAQVYRTYDLQPFDRHAVRPLAVAALGSAGYALIVLGAAGLGVGVKLAVAVVGLILLYILVLNWGFNVEDRSVVDPKGKFRRIPFSAKKP